MPPGPLFIRINASTRADRQQIISLVIRAINSSGGWVVDSKLFSNLSINLSFEIELKNITRLNLSLEDIDIRLTEKSRAALEELAGKALEGPASADYFLGTFQITFVHTEPDLRIEIPPVPG